MADDFVTIQLGYELTLARLVTARVRAAGYRVELLSMDDNGQTPGIIALQEHRLLVDRVDAAGVAAIVEPALV